MTLAEQKVIDAACAWRKARGMAIEESATWVALANAEAELSAAVRDFEAQSL